MRDAAEPGRYRGPRRTLDTAPAVLATAGAVRVSRGARPAIVYGARPSPEPIEQAGVRWLTPFDGNLSGDGVVYWIPVEEAAMVFLVTFVLVCAVPIVAVIAVTASLKGRHAVMRRAVDGRSPDPGAYELAYLAGGPLRVVNTAIAVLTRTGRLRVSRGGLLHPVRGADRPGDDVERAVLAAVSSRPGGARVSEVRHDVGGGQEMGAIEHQLIALGLIVPGATMGEGRAALGRLGLLSGVCLIMAVGTFYALLFRSGLDGMTGGLLALATVALGVTGVAGLRTRKRLRPALRGSLTRAGHDRLRWAQDAYRPGAPVMAADIAMPVAVYGLGAMGDPAAETELNTRSSWVPAVGCATGTCGGGSHDNTQSFGGGDFAGSSDTSSSSSCGSSSSSCGGGGCGGG